MRVFGIDPGSHAPGWGLVEREAGRLLHRAHGTVRQTRGAPLAERLGVLQIELGALIEEHRPDCVAVEQVFLAAGASPRSALVLGQARGVGMAAAAARKLPVHEYNARTIKLAVTGHGGAVKREVQTMVRRLLSLDRVPPQDAADALAVAVCHAQSSGLPPGARSGGRRRTTRRAARFVVRRA
ncbi:MAG: crossover junction endodeoxyribonuclease RuvC [Myxococcota bacterium]